MRYSAAFLSLIDELERFELPPRCRVLSGEAVKGRLAVCLIISGTASARTAPPAPFGVIAAKAIIRAHARAGALRFNEITALQAKIATPKARKPQSRRPSMSAPHGPAEPKADGRHKPRSAEAIAAASAKLRAQREARVAAALPLVEEARASGCLLLSEICHYLASIGHRPPQGARWSIATLSKMLPARTDEDRRARDDAFADLIEEARADGATSYRMIADWLTARGNRTARGTAWTKATVARFLGER